MDTGLTNRMALVTGASGGIGHEVVRAFRHEDAKVIIHFHSHKQRARILAEELGPSCVALGADLTDEAGHADYAASKAALTYGLARSLKNKIDPTQA